MKAKILLMALASAGAVFAGASFLTARAESLAPGFHVHPKEFGDFLTATCHGHSSMTGSVEAGGSSGKVRYKANGSGSLQVLGGSMCCPTDFSLCGIKYVGQVGEDIGNNDWTSSRTFTSWKVNCLSGAPNAVFPMCSVADGVR